LFKKYFPIERGNYQYVSSAIPEAWDQEDDSSEIGRADRDFDQNCL